MQGKRHQTNLAKRAAREASDKPILPQPQKRVAVKKTGIANLCTDNSPLKKERTGVASLSRTLNSKSSS